MNFNIHKITTERGREGERCVYVKAAEWKGHLNSLHCMTN